MRWLQGVMAAVLLALGGGQAIAQGVTEAPMTVAPGKDDLPTVFNPQWLKTPSGQALLDVYPEKAMRNGRGGSVELRCLVETDGSLSNCTTQGERPRGYGIAEAALKLSKEFQLKPIVVNGRSLGPDRPYVVIPIRFGWR